LFHPVDLCFQIQVTWLAEHIPPEEIGAAVAQPKPEKVNTSDLAATLVNPDTRRRFVTLRSDKDLTAILDAPLEKWRILTLATRQ
jgi:hypothetical protein